MMQTNGFGTQSMEMHAQAVLALSAQLRDGRIDAATVLRVAAQCHLVAGSNAFDKLHTLLGDDTLEVKWGVSIWRSLIRTSSCPSSSASHWSD